MVKEMMHHGPEYGQTFDADSLAFDWSKIKAARDKYVARLNGIYKGNLDNSNVTLLQGFAELMPGGGVAVGGAEYTADHVLVAVGGEPVLPESVRRAANSGGPGGPVGPLGTSSRTPWTLSG